MDEQRAAVDDPFTPLADVGERWCVAMSAVDVQHIDRVVDLSERVIGVQPQMSDAIANAGGLEIHVSHGHEFGTPTAANLLAGYSADVIVYGHTHRALVHRDGARLVVNPGAAGPRRFNLKPSVAKLTIVNGRAEVEIGELAG